MIPFVLHQTYNDYVPPKVEENIATYAPQYTRKLYRDNDCIAFLDRHLPQYTATFRQLRLGAHKADLFRYAVLYVEGGVYLDIKTHLLVPLVDVVDMGAAAVTTALSIIGRTVYQGVLAAPPGLPCLLRLMDLIRRRSNPRDYLQYTRDMYRVLRRVHPRMNPGISSVHQPFGLRLLKEVSVPHEPTDRYGLSCYLLWNGRRVIQTRYTDFPWTQG
jgi:hypothetical protein